MKFMGSKNRIAKYILPIMLAERKPGQWWVEPFVGGGNMIDKITGKRLGADANKHTIEALRSIRDCVDDLPKNNTEFTEEDYRRLRTTNDYPHKGYAGFAFSYGGKWLGGWRRDGEGVRDYVREAYDNAVRQSPKLGNVLLIYTDFQGLHVPSQSLLYCDPPYASTTGYKGSFASEVFWGWCLEKAAGGHTIFVSEYTAPSGFECVWEKEIVSSLTRDTGAKRGVERLFRLRSNK